MVAAQHKLSRRAVLAGALAAPVAVPLALPRHCEDPGLDPGDAATQCSVSDVTAAGLVDLRSPSARSARNDDKWRKALALYARAEAEVAAVAHSEDDRLYDRALGRHNAALARLLRAPAPNLDAVARKLDLILEHVVFELTFGEACFEALRRDLERLAGFQAEALWIVP